MPIHSGLKKGLTVLALALAPAIAQADTMRLANVVADSAKEAGIEFKRLVEEKTGGSLEINLYPDNQLGDDRVVLESTIFGDIDIGIASTSPLANLIPDFYLFDAPFLFLSSEEAYAALDGEIGQEILASLEGKGLKGLAFWENGFRNYTGKSNVVAEPSDLEGKKVRTMENRVHLAAWRALGANPTPMAFPELFTALQQGTVDAQENPLSIIDSNRFLEVQDQVSLTQHVYTPFIVFMNLDRYNALDESERQAINESIETATEFQRQRSQELEAEVVEKFSNQEGITVTELTPEQKTLWQQTMVDADIYSLVSSMMDNPEYLEQLLSD
ncbi:DctP family TRAP transporter solute-binding subunit [Halomonas salipaludis]|uniref:C4-dicarboxylate ABC transporter substrate-binding protein n=1 Tax=Halomonas salipaludis TaxID=2032625 RepID=A0A2A2F118_9GAMM|nr:DctP family TRAP transporter solute-binding subunit [Halomonas salipaludis]PAU78329.1 C4-dicarboxylate ABC transporter substrate-binding protein [Halomonas salipaludis]